MATAALDGGALAVCMLAAVLRVEGAVLCTLSRGPPRPHQEVWALTLLAAAL